MADKTIYEIPHAATVDGMILFTKEFHILFNEKIDERKLTRENDILVATYPRTGEL